MVKRTTRQAVELEPAQEPTDELDIDERLGAEFGRGANLKLSLYRITPGSGTDGIWIDDISPADIEDTRRYVRDEFGGGTYILRVKKDGRHAGSYRFGIEAPRKPVNGHNQDTKQGAPAQQTDPVLAQILARMDARLDAIERRPQMDPFDMFSKVADLVKSTRTEGATIGPDQLMKAWEGGLTAAKTQFELISNIGKAGGETSLMDLAKSLIDSLGPTIGASLADSLSRRPGAVNGGEVHRPPAPALPGVDPARALDDNLRAVIGLLERKAAVNSDVETCAEMALEMLDPNLIPMLQQEGILDRLAIPFPGINQFRAWFDALRAEMLTLLREQEGPGGQGERVDSPGNMPAGNT